MKKYTIEYFQDLALKKNGKCLSKEYINGKTKIEFQCFCGHVWIAEPRHIIEGRWCPKCGCQKGRKYEVDHEFFSSDTEKSFYVAGFLAADGWKTRKSSSYGIGLQLSSKDINHLNNIKSILKCNSPLQYIKRSGYICNNYKISNTEAYSFIFHSEKCYKDLERFSVVENKTYIMRFPEWLKNHPLVYHYMRGYIDGDGCFSIGKNKGQDPHISFAMKGTKEFLEVFHEVLLINNICNKNTERSELKYKVGKKYLAFDNLRYNGNIIISKMYDFLYKEATIFLPRKEEIAKKAKEYRVIGVRNRKSRVNTLGFTKEILLEKLKELGSGKSVAKKYNCTPAAISWWVSYLGVSKNEYNKAIGVLDKEEVGELPYPNLKVRASC